ncbi:Oxygen-dependent choline dehydrogenase [Madurella mycetomatis]|uniref:Oxygen-dependent choline dehydrogenase n=1 Tax=Madurella mycetomatis TaxID=100816 RepID=A0A175WGU4_9PEZI|nr:Oxygen-dependent choline dehydrogenase [Madurella mycetomatis]
MTRLTTLVAAILTLSQRASLGHARELRASKIFHSARDVDSEYDYVIVGGGTAGLTVADRLTEDGETTVLVVEYGELSNSTSISRVQGGFSGMSDASLMYSINSVPQVNLRNRTTAVLAGKVVGGSSAVNAMMTVRGTAEDYDRWGSFFSNSSHWSWEGMLPYFKKALTFVPPDEAVTKSSNITFDTSFWGNTSGVYAGWPSFQYPGTTFHLEAFRGLPGVPFAEDSGSGKPGVYWYPTFMDPELVVRSYARTGHYDSLNRDNYHLVTGSKVTRVILNGTTATGVSFVQVGSSGAETVVNARKEVIVAAGGIHSPQVLQLSGIGPSKLLASANITTVVDLPGVGQNFQDHPIVMSSYMFRNFPFSPSSDDMFRNRTFANWAAEVWRANRTGPNSIATGNAAAWLPFPVISPRWSNISSALAAQDHGSYLPDSTDATVSAGYRAQMLSYSSALAANNTAFYNLVFTGGASNGIIVDLHPLSRGTVNIDVRDPYNRVPVVDYRALTNPLDAAIMTEILRFTRRYYMDNPLTESYQAREMQPGSNVQSDEQWGDYLEETVSPSEFHPAGTCAMMPRELGGVVDEELRVYGVEGLRVVDASIMPTLPGANTCQTVYAVAEKAADLIRYGTPKTVEE